MKLKNLKQNLKCLKIKNAPTHLEQMSKLTEENKVLNKKVMEHLQNVSTQIPTTNPNSEKIIKELR
jgi:hypothetical protein